MYVCTYIYVYVNVYSYICMCVFIYSTIHLLSLHSLTYPLHLLSAYPISTIYIHTHTHTHTHIPIPIHTPIYLYTHTHADKLEVVREEVGGKRHDLGDETVRIHILPYLYLYLYPSFSFSISISISFLISIYIFILPYLYLYLYPSLSWRRDGTHTWTPSSLYIYSICINTPHNPCTPLI